MKTKLGKEARTRSLMLLKEKEYSVLTALISEYRGGKLDPYRAFGYIGELAAVRSLASALDSEGAAEIREIEKETRRN